MNSLFSRLLLTLALGFMAYPSSGGESPAVVKDWRPYAQRSALMPQMEMDEAGILISSASGGFSCNGAWRKTFPIKENQSYRFSVQFQSKDVSLPRRSILAQIDWKDKNGKRVGQPDYPPNIGADAEGWMTIAGVFSPSPGAELAVVDLIFRWDAQGKVRWKNPAFAESAPLAPRKVVLATVNYRPRNSKGSQENREAYRRFLRQAGEKGADIVCLPEGITIVGTPLSIIDAAETIPGPSTKFLGETAKEFSMYIVAGIYEQTGEIVYNTSVLIDRQGQLAGTYRKTSLPREEIEDGVTPGGEFPVFQTDFGKIGMMICWDVFFPEPARALASQGAEIILLPIWGGNEDLIKSRAIENQIYLITSSFDARTGIWNRRGEMAAEAKENGSVALYEADLNEQTLWEWLGDYRARIPRESPVVKGEIK
ncbi:MAG: carbon-nitrogen hydrolase family protein [Candidatus Omnitrophota bacterium]